LRLREVFESVASQTGGKFIFSSIDSNSAHQSLRDAFFLLLQSGLVYNVYHSSGRGIPLGATMNRKKFKTIFLDTGI